MTAERPASSRNKLLLAGALGVTIGALGLAASAPDMIRAARIDSGGKVLRIALKSEGYDISEAENGEQGLASIVRQQPDLVILDLGLPDGDGLELLAELRSFSKVPVIVLSVRSGDVDKIKALDYAMLVKRPKLTKLDYLVIGWRALWM